MGGGGGPQPAFPPTLAAIQKNVFGGVCSNCHFPGGPGPMPLTSAEVSYANLVNVPSVESALLRIAPGDPDQSYLFHKITAAPGIVGDRMPPPPEAALTRGEIESIRKWIAQGALP
jgi:mono/diheme cytochrome c family protein